MHTEVGNKCYASRVNRRYVPLTTLKTGEQVEILAKIVNRIGIGWLIRWVILKRHARITAALV